MSSDVQTLGRDQAASLREELRGIWLSAFLPPPYSEPEDQAEWLLAEFDPDRGREGFRCCVAAEDGRPVGFGCGFRWTDGQHQGPWSKALIESVGSDRADRWIRGQFAVACLAVVPELQGRGIGGRLHDALLEELPESRAWLVTYDFDCAARHLYQRRGWIELGRGPLGSGGRIDLVLGLEV